MRKSGYILHEDSFRVAIITGFRNSANRKTGAMLQVWILVKAQNPIKAIQTGKDSLVCGNCPHRGLSCYVEIGRAPMAVWKKYNRGGYDRLTDFSVLRDWNVRFGAYGDPAFIPQAVWQNVIANCRRFTGYTHQWRNPLFAGLRGFLMASVDSHEEQIQATMAGWRTFRIQSVGNARFSDEIVCPASKEAGERVQCDKCLLCCGKARGNLKNIVINVHGSGSKYFGKN